MILNPRRLDKISLKINMLFNSHLILNAINFNFKFHRNSKTLWTIIKMGNENCKLKLKKKKKEIIPENETENETAEISVAEPVPKLNDVDLEFLSQQTGSSKSDIQNTFEIFIKDNSDGILTKTEFIRIYNELRPEPAEYLVNVSEAG